MHFTKISSFAILATAIIAQEKVFQGFNSGNTLADKSAKKQSDFESEFKTAKSLHGSPGVFNSVRLYTNIQADTKDTPISAFAAAIATNTSMLLGIWCSGTTSITSELNALKSAISQYGDSFANLVVGISVGSEDLYRISESGIKNKAGLGQGPDQMVKFITQVRDTIKSTSLKDKPVGHVDTWSAWTNTTNKAVIKAVDFVGADLYPYYEDDKDNVIDNAKSIFDDTLNKTITAAGNTPVWITETGWPTTGETFGKGVPSVDNAKKYWDDIGCGLFGKTNVWWYNLRDSNPDNTMKFAITKDLSSTPQFNLTCSAESGAPTAVNTESAARGMKGVFGSGLLVWASFLGTVMYLW